MFFFFVSHHYYPSFSFMYLLFWVSILDTMNTASRMESTGAPNMIQVSEETATILKNEGFEKWLRPRDDLVHAKGKGLLQTYWLEIDKDNSSSSSDHRQLGNSQKSKVTLDSKSSFVHKLYSGSLDDSNEINSISGFDQERETNDDNDNISVDISVDSEKSK